MDFLTLSDFSVDQLEKYFLLAEEIREGKTLSCNGKIMASLFFQPSTRTRLSFESAMLRLGGQVISVSDKESTSSSKGETIADTIRVVSHYADVLVVRSSESHFNWDFDKSLKPVINAGSSVEHPTQALIDAYTVWRHFGKKSCIIEDLNIALIGDLENSRTINSFCQFMSRSETNSFFALDTTGQNNPLVYSAELVESVCYLHGMEKIIGEMDVIYLNRIQTEKWVRSMEKSSFCMDEKLISKLKPKAIILNPGPRQEELPPQFDNFHKNKMFEQVQNGLYIRMALLYQILSQVS